MSDRISLIEARLRELDQTVASLSARLATLEGGRQPNLAHPGTPEPRHLGTASPAALDFVSVLSLTGRSCIVLGGAYLLRALTDAGRLPNGAGVALGLAYALLWIAAADRARGLSQTFHGVTGVLIGLPILWEATTRFQMLSAAGSAVALVLFASLALAIAYRRGLPIVASAANAGGIALSFALVAQTGATLPFAAAQLALGVVCWLIADARRWPWIAGLSLASVTVLGTGLAVRAASPLPGDSTPAAVAVLLALPLAFVGLSLSRTLYAAAPVRVIDVVGSAATLAVALAGAAAALTPAVWPAGPLVGTILGATLIALAAVGYEATFGRVLKRQGLSSTFYFHSTLALGLFVAGLVFALPGAARVGALGAATVFTAWAGVRFAFPTLTLHAATFGLAAMAASGLLALSAEIWIARVTEWPALSVRAWLALAAIAGALMLPRARRSGSSAFHSALGRLVLTLALVIGLGGALLVLAGPTIAGNPARPGAVASAKTAMLAGAAVLLALIGRTRSFRELGRLVYPILIVGGIKLVAEDFPVSPPASLFLALACYGVALVTAPRLRGRRRPRSAARRSRDDAGPAAA